MQEESKKLMTLNLQIARSTVKLLCHYFVTDFQKTAWVYLFATSARISNSILLKKLNIWDIQCTSYQMHRLKYDERNISNDLINHKEVECELSLNPDSQTDLNQ